MSIWMNPFIYWLRQNCLLKLLMLASCKPVRSLKICWSLWYAIYTFYVLRLLISLPLVYLEELMLIVFLLLLRRMNRRTSSRSSSCGSLRCSMAPSVRKECRGPVQLPLSTTALEWREPRQGGNDANIQKGESNHLFWDRSWVRIWGCLAGYRPNTVSRNQHRGRPVPDKYIYLEFCFLLPGCFGYGDIGCCSIYWVVQGFVAMWFVFCSFGACGLINGALECSVVVFICLLETDLRMLFVMKWRCKSFCA